MNQATFDCKIQSADIWNHKAFSMNKNNSLEALDKNRHYITLKPNVK